MFKRLSSIMLDPDPLNSSRSAQAVICVSHVVNCTFFRHGRALPRRSMARKLRHGLNGYLLLRVPSLFPASGSSERLSRAALECMSPWRTRYPSS